MRQRQGGRGWISWRDRLPVSSPAVAMGRHERVQDSRWEVSCHEVIVANPRQVALIARGHRETDRLDAERLARLGRLDPAMPGPIHHRSAESQQHLAVVRSRDALVRSCTASSWHRRTGRRTRSVLGLRVLYFAGCAGRPDHEGPGRPSWLL